MKTLLLCAGVAIGLLWGGCSPRPSDRLQGYVEGEFVYVAAPVGGTLTNLAVRRGQAVASGQVLFALEGEAEAAAEREARERVTQAQARLDNLTKGRRPSEILAVESQLERARVNLRQSELELERRTRLSDGHVISAEELDLARNRRDADRAQVASLTADLETARLGGRVDDVTAAQAELEALRAALVRAQWSVKQKKQVAPAQGAVQETLFREGEYVGAGMPVVQMLPPQNIKVRFFVPQPRLVAFPLGVAVLVSIDGVSAPLSGTVS